MDAEDRAALNNEHESENAALEVALDLLRPHCEISQRDWSMGCETCRKTWGSFAFDWIALAIGYMLFAEKFHTGYWVITKVPWC